jgi:hypothetical protein
MDESFSLYNSFYNTFVGTNLGRIFKVTNANTASYASTVLTSPITGTISDIEFGASEMR